MKRITFLILAMIGVAGLTYGQGIHFEKKSWSEVQELSKELDRPIFVDVYTTWCGPCKRVAKNVFTQEKVGKFFNSNFINAKIDGESEEGVEFVKKYNVKSYPTFLYIGKDGTVLYRFVGAKTASDFIGVVDKIKVASKHGGWARMDSIYKSGYGDANLFLDYYSLLEGEDKEKALNAYLLNLPEAEFLKEDVKTYIEKISIYNNELMNRFITGIVTKGGNDNDFYSNITSPVTDKLSEFLSKSIENRDKQLFDQIMKLHNRYYTEQKWRRLTGDYLGNDYLFRNTAEFSNLLYTLETGLNEDTFTKRFEAFMKYFDETANVNNFYSDPNPVNILSRGLGSFVQKDQLNEGNDYIISNLLRMIDYYWLLSEPNKVVKQQCFDWLTYINKINLYNYNNVEKMSHLLIEMGYKKEGYKLLKEKLALHVLLKNESDVKVKNLKRRIEKLGK